MLKWSVRANVALLIALSIWVSACSGPTAGTPTTQPAALPAPTSTPASMTASTPGEHMVHKAQHGGQLGMSEELHIELVSEQPGEYKVYLSDPAGNPLPLEGVTLEVALIDPAGNELLVLPAQVAESGDYFIATGGPTDLTQADVRVKVVPTENTKPVEMDFTLQYPAPPTDTPAVPRSTPSPITTPGAAATTTAPPPMPPLECKTGEPWSQTQEGLTLAMCFDPHPPQLGRPVTYEAMIIDAARQPVADASVEMALVGGMAGMEGEHDEDFAVQLASQGAGRYATQATVGPSDLALTGIRIKVLSGRESWSFSISVDELGPR